MLKALLQIGLFSLIQFSLLNAEEQNNNQQDGEQEIYIPEEDLVQVGPRYILKLETNTTTHELFTDLHIGSPPKPRRMKVVVEDFGIYVECYECQNDLLNLMNKQNQYITYRNCSNIPEYYEIFSSDTGRVYNCRQKQFRQRHNCQHCNRDGHCEYNYTDPDGYEQQGLQGEDYFLLNEQLDLSSYHYMQLNEARTRFPLICIDKFDDDQVYDGQLGLADNHYDRYSALNLVDSLSRVKANANNTFDICLHAFDQEFPEEAGYISFGHQQMKNSEADYMIYYYSDNFNGQYLVNLTSFQIGKIGKITYDDIKENQYKKNKIKKNIFGVMSTGIPGLQGPAWFIDKIKEEFLLDCNQETSKCRYIEVDQDLCLTKTQDIDGESFYNFLPDIVFFNHNRNIIWKAQHYLMQDNEIPEKYCVAISYNEPNTNSTIFNAQVSIGSKIMEGFRVQFDRKNKIIRFQENTCIFNTTAHHFVYYTKPYFGGTDFKQFLLFVGILGGFLGLYVLYKVFLMCLKSRKKAKKSRFFSKFSNQDED